jgi:hypothetical protein
VKTVVMIFGAIIIVAAGIMYKNPFGKVNVYGMPVSAVYQSLSTMSTDVNQGALLSAEMTVSGDGEREVYLNVGDTRFCTISLTPEKESSTEINVSCENYGEGAMAGMTGRMRRNVLIERIDSTLKNRPYNKDLALGGSAAGWPADTVQHGNLMDAQAKALEMDAETRRMADAQ